METLVNLMIFSMCINVGMAVLGGVLPFESYETYQSRLMVINNTIIRANDTAAQAGSIGSVNPALSFGAFDTATKIFFNFLTGSHYVDMLSTLGMNFPPNFIYGVLGINAIYLVVTFITLIAGRVFRGSP